MKKKQKHPKFPKQIMMDSLGKTTTMNMMTPFLLPTQIISSVFTCAAGKSLHQFKLLEIIHCLFSLFLFFLRLFLSLLPSITPTLNSSLNPIVVKREHTEILHEGDSGIARALSQILAIMNEIPVTSRKYETVRCLAEKVIVENLEEDCEVLREVNRRVLSNAFGRTLGQLEAAMLEQERARINELGGSGSLDHGLSWVRNAVRVVRDGALSRVGGLMEEVTCTRPVAVGWSAEKFAAEIYWLGQKLVACGNGEEAVAKWGSASNLAFLALSAEPRIQGSLVKVSAFLIKHAKVNGDGNKGDEMETEERRKTILISWLPLLCCASNGTDSPVLSNSERMELEKVLEDIIEMLGQIDEQERVLALWLHHFTSCPSSDWPNLQACYARWCTASRKLPAAR